MMDKSRFKHKFFQIFSCYPGYIRDKEPNTTTSCMVGISRNIFFRLGPLIASNIILSLTLQALLLSTFKNNVVL